MKKLIFIDFDGTLLGYLGTKHNVSEQNKKAIIAAVKAGYEIIPCTGRNLNFINKINEQVNGAFNYAIASTGGIVYDLKNKKALNFHQIPSDAIDKVCTLTKENNFIIGADCIDGSYCSQPHSPFYEYPDIPIQRFLKNKKAFSVVCVSTDFELLESKQVEIQQIKGMAIAHRHKALKDPSYPRSGYAFIDIMAPNVNKGTGVVFLANYLGISKADTIAIGDDYNDLSMFAECGYSVAMGNALPDVKKRASQITDTNDNNGVAKFLLDLIHDTYNNI